MDTMLAMGLLRKGDEALHMSDGSHRWVAPDGTEQDIWEATVRAHVERHKGGEQELPRPSPRDGTTPKTTGRGLPRSTT